MSHYLVHDIICNQATGYETTDPNIKWPQVIRKIVIYYVRNNKHNNNDQESDT